MDIKKLVGYTSKLLESTASRMGEKIAEANPKLTEAEVQKKAIAQATKKLEWERVQKPALEKRYGALGKASYAESNPSKMQNTPEVVAERKRKANEFLDQPTEPWTPPPPELQAFDRNAIKDALEGFPDVEQSSFPRDIPTRASTAHVEGMYTDPENRALIQKQIKRGLPLGGETFYASLYPVKQAALEAGMAPEKFDKWIHAVAPASARNSIMNEMAVGQFLRNMNARGIPLTEENVAAEMAKFKETFKVGLPLMPIHRQGVQNVLEGGMNLRDQNLANIPTNYKIPTYGTQKAGDFKHSAVLDVHEAAGQSQGSPYHPYFNEAGGFGNTEYNAGEQGLLGIAEELGIPGGMAQAGRWFGGGELTGLRSPRGDALDLLEKQVAYALKEQGKQPNPALIRKEVLNQINTGEGVLLPWYKKSGLPDVRETGLQRKKGGEVRKHGHSFEEDLAAAFAEVIAEHNPKPMHGEITVKTSAPVKMAMGGAVTADYNTVPDDNDGGAVIQNPSNFAKGGVARKRNVDELHPIHMGFGGLAKRALRGLKGTNVAEGNKTSIIKDTGGNWLSGSVEEHLSPLRQTARGATPSERLARYNQLLEAATDDASRALIQRDINTATREDALDKWIGGNLTKYVKNQMGTADDPVRKLAEQEIVHYSPSGYVDRGEHARTLAGTPQLGKSDKAKAWENITDYIVEPSTVAKEISQMDFFANAQKLFKKPLTSTIEPWMTKVDPSTKVYGINDTFNPQNLGYDHIMDVLREDLTTGRILPENLNKMSMEHAVRRTHEYDTELAKRMKESSAAAREGLPVRKEYPNTGFRWVELNKPGSFAAESDAMGHSARGYEPPKGHADWVPASGDSGNPDYGLGGWEAIKSGKVKMYSLVDKEGKSHATIEVHPGDDTEAFYQANKKVLDNPIFRRELDLMADPNVDASLGHQYVKNAKKLLTENNIKYNEAEHNFPDINQIKPPGNYWESDPSRGRIANSPTYKEDIQPYMQDFVKSGQWSEVRDLENTGLKTLDNAFSDYESKKNFSRANPNTRYVNQKEIDDWNKQWGSSGDTPVEGMANGGQAHYNKAEQVVESTQDLIDKFVEMYEKASGKEPKPPKEVFRDPWDMKNGGAAPRRDVSELMPLDNPHEGMSHGTARPATMEEMRALQPWKYEEEGLEDPLLSPDMAIGTGLPTAIAKLLGKGVVGVGKTLAPKANKLLEEYMVKSGMQLPATVWHGSQHKFPPTAKNPLGEFDASKIGTGEGAQAYGHGHYMAGNPNVAGYYKQAGSGQTPGYDMQLVMNGKELTPIVGTPHEDAVNALRSAFDDAYSSPFGAAREMLGQNKSALKILDMFEKNGASLQEKQGNIYKVDLPDAHIAKMLDWDKPLSQQPEAVRKALEKAAPPIKTVDTMSREELIGTLQYIDPNGSYTDKAMTLELGRPATLAELRESAKMMDVDEYLAANMASDKHTTGESAYTQLVTKFGGGENAWTAAGQAKASELLAKQDIPGIKYLDAGSRPRNVVDNRLSALYDKHQGNADAAVNEMMRGIYNTPAQKESMRQEFLKQLETPNTHNYVVFPGNEDMLNILERNTSKASGGAIHMGVGGAISKIIKPSEISQLKEYILQQQGKQGAKRVERAADEVPNLESMYQQQALRRAFNDDNASALMVINPADFERYARPLRDVTNREATDRQIFVNRKNKMNTDDYVKHLQAVKGFQDVPFLQLDKGEQGLPIVPHIAGHEGRHRSRALANSGVQSSLVRMTPRAELREGFPRSSQEEYLDALQKEMEMTDNMVRPETYTIPRDIDKSIFEQERRIIRPNIRLPEMFSEGGVASKRNVNELHPLY